MQETGFDWNRSYVIPASLCFRPIPSGGLQVDCGAGEPSVEVQRDWVPLLLAFARAQTAAAAYKAATEEWEADRASFRQLLEAWVAKGLLRLAGTSPQAPSRLALFTRATEAEAWRRVPLRSHFPLQRPLEFYPGLETREIHDCERFPWAAALEASFPVLQVEFARLVEAGPGFSTVYRSQTSSGSGPPPIFGPSARRSRRPAACVPRPLASWARSRGWRNSALRCTRASLLTPRSLRILATATRNCGASCRSGCLAVANSRSESTKSSSEREDALSLTIPFSTRRGTTATSPVSSSSSTSSTRICCPTRCGISRISRARGSWQRTSWIKRQPADGWVGQAQRRGPARKPPWDRRADGEPKGRDGLDRLVSALR